MVCTQQIDGVLNSCTDASTKERQELHAATWEGTHKVLEQLSDRGRGGGQEREGGLEGSQG